MFDSRIDNLYASVLKHNVLELLTVKHNLLFYYLPAEGSETPCYYNCAPIV